MLILRIALPRYSKTWPRPPAAPFCAMIARITSLALTPRPSSPSTLMAKVLGRSCSRHWVASTWPTSLVPMPKASAPNAPWVLVWLSPQTMVVPGWVMPISGPTTWTIPWTGPSMSNSVTPKSSQFSRSVRTWVAASLGHNVMSTFRVGIAWSMVAKVRSGRRTGKPRSRSVANACGDVTSCTRCVSTYKTAGAPASCTTTCASQTFSKSVLGSPLFIA